MDVVTGVRGAARARSLRPAAAMIRLDLFSTLTTLAPYLIVAVAAALAGFVLQNDLHRVQEDGLLVIDDPFAVSLYGGVLLLAVYLAASAAMAVAREREQCAVELLCYGPVSALSYLLAKFAGHVLQFEVLVRLPAPEFHVNPVYVLRWVAFAISSVTQWLLPFGYVDRELTVMLRGDLAGALGAAAVGSVYAMVVLILAAAVLDRTGIRR
jgi:hypothetical protein